MTHREIPFGRPWITDEDREAVMRVLHGHVLTHGPESKAFETEFSAFMGGGHSVSVANATAALHLAYIHFKIGPGDEVVVPAQTHTATVHAVELVGAKPVFVDCDPATGNVTPAAVEAAITPRTKAIGVVHFLGIPVDMPGIMKVAERHGLKVIEDCALAVGSRVAGKHVGLFGDAGAYSFYPVKHFTTGDGGMFVTRHADVADGVSRFRAFGVDRTFNERKVPGVYDVPSLGLNYRLCDILAALGRPQLRRMPENLALRARNFGALKKLVAEIPEVSVLDATRPEHVNSHYCLTMRLDGAARTRRDEIVHKLNAAGIGTSVYYPHPVPRLAYYRGKYGYDASKYPEAIRISDHAIALPVAPHVTPDDVAYMGETIPRILREVRA